MKRLFAAIALCVAFLALTGCADDPPSPSNPHTSIGAGEGLTGSSEPSHSFTTVDEVAAVELATKFIKAYGTFTPAAPQPGQTWINSWRKWADKNVIEQATDTFDAMWGWTWDQQVQAQDVTPTLPASVTDQGFGTLKIQIPSKRYVLGLLARRIEDGHWQNVDFEVVVGPKKPGIDGAELTVYKIAFAVTGGA